MKNAVQIISLMSYINDLIRTGNKHIIIGSHDRYAYDCGLVGFLKACYHHNYRDNGQKVFWLDTARNEPMTEAEQREYILPLVSMSQDELNAILKYAGITEEEIAMMIDKINMCEKVITK